MKKNKNLHVVILLISILLTSCFKDEDSEKRAEEQRKIEEYVAANNLTPTYINSYGLYYFNRKTGTGDTISSSSDYALIKYRGRFLDGTMFDTSDSTEAKSLTSYLPMQAIGGLFKISMNSGFYGMVQGLSLMKEGGKASFIMPSLLVYNDYVPRIYEVDSFKVIHNIVDYEMQQFRDSIAARNRDMSDSLSNGSYLFLYQDTSNLKKPVAGDNVTVTYSGYIIDGRVFSKTSAYSFIVGSSQVPGLDEAVMKMAVGVNAKVYVPYYSGYGTSTAYNTNTGQIVIPAYSGLKYNVRVDNIK